LTNINNILIIIIDLLFGIDDMTQLINTNEELLKFMDTFGNDEGIRKTSQFNGSSIKINADGIEHDVNIVMTGIHQNMMDIPGFAERSLIFEFSPNIGEYSFIRMRNLPNHVDSKWWTNVEFMLSRNLKINYTQNETNPNDPNNALTINVESFEFNLK
jgi:hypothetical protein